MLAVLLDHAGRVKLADFGIACIKSGHYVTVTNMCGTAAYTAPEVFENQRVRPLSLHTQHPRQRACRMPRYVHLQFVSHVRLPAIRASAAACTSVWG